MSASPAKAMVTEIQRELPQRELRLITIIVGLYIVLGESDRLISRVSSDGYSASMVDASRPRSPIPRPTSESQPWLTLHNLDSGADLFVGVFTVVDCILAVAYGVLLWTLLRQLRDRKVIGQESPLRLFTKPRPWLAPVAVGFDILENILLVIVVYGSPERTMSAGLALFACLATLAKWVALLLAVAPMLCAVFFTTQGRSWFGRWGRALYRQRFSLVAVVPIAALALVPGPGVFDQIPDVQRAWLEFGDGRGVSGFLHAGVATLVLGVVAFGLFLMGRLFTDDAGHRCDDPGERQPTQLWQWLFGPVVVGLGALALIVTGSLDSIRGKSLLVFSVIPLVVAAFSWWRRRRPGKMEGLPESQSIPVSEVWRVGDMLSGCRVLVTHLDVSVEVSEEDEEVHREIPCTDAGAPLAYSRDIRAYMPRDGVELDKDDACLEGLRASTAAMLAARFPYVTPSGVVGPCGGTPRAQLIDGGYIEGSGLGTLVDMAPKLLAEVSAKMTVQPIVVYLDNGRGGDLQTAPPHPRSELMTPPMGALTAGGTQNSTAAWLQRARALSAGTNVLEPEVFVVAQGSAPAVEAPLGWVLSQASRDDMDRSLEEHVERACTGQPATEDPAESRNQGHPNLAELLNQLGVCG